MICRMCKTEMVLGKAIESDDNYCRSIVPRPLITSKTLKMIDVYKCPKCGHSEEIE